MIQLNDWTPCTEKLPDKDGLYLVTYEDGDIGLLDFALDLYAFNKFYFVDFKGCNQPGFIDYDSEYGYSYATENVVAWTEAPAGWEGVKE